MNEINACKKFTIATLKAYAPLAAIVAGRVFYGVAPRGEPYPLVLIAQTGGTDNPGVGTERLSTEPLLVIRGVNEEEEAIISGRIAGLIDLALVGDQLLPGSGAQGNTTLDGATYFVGGIRRENPVETVEDTGEIIRIYTGGIYRFFVERIS